MQSTRIFFLVALLSHGSGCGSAESTSLNASDSIPAATASITPEYIELGEVLPGATQDLLYAIHADDSEYEVVSCHASCGCATPVVDRDVISRGGAAEVKVTFKVPTHATSFRHSFHIKLRNTATGTTSLMSAAFSGRSEWPLSSSPSALTLGELEIGRTHLARIDLHGRFVTQLQIKSISVSSEPGAISILPQVLPNRIEVSINPQIGLFHGIVRLETNCPDRPEIVIPVKATGVTSENRISPAVLSLGIVRDRNPVVRTLVVRSIFHPIRLWFDDEGEWQGKIVSVIADHRASRTVLKLELGPAGCDWLTESRGESC